MKVARDWPKLEARAKSERVQNLTVNEAVRILRSDGLAQHATPTHNPKLPTIPARS